MFRNGAGLVNPWKGAVQVVVKAGNVKRFEVTFSGVPTDACIVMGSMVLGASSLLELWIDGAPSWQPSVARADANCKSKNRSVHDLAWTFS